MSIDEEGFLSPELSDWIVKHRKENVDWINYTKKLNRTAQRLLLTSSVTFNSLFDARLIARLLFTRALSNFQGAVLLSEWGMIVEARTLARSCLETTFCLAATVKGDSEFVNRMFLQDLDQRRRAANWLLSRVPLLELVEDDVEYRLREIVNTELAKFSPLAIEEMAKKGDIHDMYFCYRILSGDSAHPTFSALTRYIGEDGDQNNHFIRWGPDCGTEIFRDTVGLSCRSLIIACEAINRVLTNSESEREEAKRELAQYFEELKRLEPFDASVKA